MPKPRKRKRYETFIGIDPGKQGGLCFVAGDGIIHSSPMPETERDTWNWFECIWDLNEASCAVIEQINPAIPGIGKSSMSKLYGSYMSLRACLIAASIPFDAVSPQKWQKGIVAPKRLKTDSQPQWKNKLRGRAQELFPQLDVWNETKKVQLAVADSLLIAEYCRRSSLGES